VRDPLIHPDWLERKRESRTLAILSAARRIDADRRNPRERRLFGLDNRIGVSVLAAGAARPSPQTCWRGRRSRSSWVSSARRPMSC
jgi:hypothetical protein